MFTATKAQSERRAVTRMVDGSAVWAQDQFVANESGPTDGGLRSVVV